MEKVEEIEKLEETSENLNEVIKTNDENKQLENEEKVEVEQSEIEENKVTEIEEIEEKHETEINEETLNAVIGEMQEEQSIDGTKNSEKNDILHKYSILITIISMLLFIGLAIFSTIFALTNRNSNKIVSGISVKGIDVSGLTYNEAYEKVAKVYSEKMKHNITLKHNEYETSITPEQIEAKFKIQEAIDTAYNYGRSGKVLKDNYSIVYAGISKIDINPAFSYNEKALSDFIDSTSNNLPDAVKQSDYYVDGDKLIINKGEAGLEVKKQELNSSIIKNIVEVNNETQEIQIPTTERKPDEINLENIYTEIRKSPQDAYYTKEPFEVHPHVDGIDFNISIEEAKSLLNTENQQVVIPLKITKPNVTTNQIGTEAFPNLLASYSTTFSTKAANRTTNIRLASNKINGVVLMPGEQFSYNKVVGKRTAQAGFKSAPAYSGGKVVNDIGGGICQVSSTLYNTALRANLEIIKRSNHRFATGYVPLSTDATVSWGGPEFIFKNSRKYPIKIVSKVNGGKITVDIYGCKEETEYEVVIKSETLQTIPMKTEYRTNTSLPQGTTKTVQKGHGGYKSRAYRILKLNGKVVSKQLLSTDTYAQLPTIIEKN
ncbi:MAG: hypothetical protein HFJ57_00140 [Clostridia bacterium]|nr:hypothetical protein [Clostridia bacterium]